MSDLRVDIRTATAADAHLLAELGARTFRDTFEWANTEADMTAYLAGAFGIDLQAVEIADPSGEFLIADVDGVSAGYVRLRRGPAPPDVAGSRPMEVVRCYADVPWIGRGIGSRLMDSSLARASAWDCDVVWLDVYERNPVAIAFYERWGFAVVGRQSFLLGEDVQDDLVMARAMTSE
jgi:ribosomal protein S18 acetylase RimI-like enzyme